MRKRVVSLENVNLFLLSKKMDQHIKEQGLVPCETKTRLVQMSLRHDVLHLPKNIPFIVAVRHCEGEKSVVFDIRQGKFAIINPSSISSETNIGRTFKIGQVEYVLKDTINGMRRYAPKFS